MKTILLLSVLVLSGCTTASKARVYHDGKTFGRSVLHAGGALVVDAFNQWLNEQK